MKEYLRRALFDSLSDRGEQNRNCVIHHIQKHYEIRFTEGYCPRVDEIELALQLTLGAAGRIFIKRFEEELEKYAIPVKARRRPELAFGRGLSST